MQDSPFQIAADYLDVIRHGESIRIKDRVVQGVSTHLLRAENWMESDDQRRVVDVEYLGKTARPR